MTARMPAKVCVSVSMRSLHGFRRPFPQPLYKMTECTLTHIVSANLQICYFCGIPYVQPIVILVQITNSDLPRCIFRFPWQCAEDSVFLLHQVAPYSRTMKPYLRNLKKSTIHNTMLGENKYIHINYSSTENRNFSHIPRLFNALLSLGYDTLLRCTLMHLGFLHYNCGMVEATESTVGKKKV